MNIFILDNDITKCAQYHNDKHVIKMILETSQLLCTAHWENDSEAPYKSTHKNHPCAIWARHSKQNYMWLTKLGLALCSEFEFRRGKVHKSKEVLRWCLSNVPKLDSIGLTDFALAMPDEYKTDCAVESYRNYYLNDKRHLASWELRGKPDWYC